MDTLDLPFAVLSVSLVARDEVRLPPFPGSKLEGAFGRALYELACTQTQRDTCQGCPLHDVCPYGLTYAPGRPDGVLASSLATPPRPVVFRVAYGQAQVLRPGESLRFGLVVIGQAVRQLPYLLAALREVGRQGLGHTRGRLELDEVRSLHPYTGEAVTLMRGAELTATPAPVLLNADDLPAITGQRLRLSLRSLTHLKVEQRMAERLHFPVLIRALQRRMSNLEQTHGGQRSLGADFSVLPLLAREVETAVHDLRPVSQLRKGSRPHQKTNMEGLIGTLEYRGDFRPFSALLRFGEQLGVGKWAHFGAGLYDLESVP